MYRRTLAHALVAIAMAVGLMTPANAAPSLAEIQAKVRYLEEEATTAAEGAQEAKVKLIALTRTLNGIKAKAAVQGETLSALQKSLGTIAIEQYKAGGLGQSLELLFSSDPTLYLSSAGALDAISRRKSAQLRKYEAAQQRLSATTLTVNDKLALVAAAEKKFKAQSAKAQEKLAEAEALLSKLTKAERERLAKLAAEQEDADQADSQAAARALTGISGRAGIAIKYALKQIGDRYVFGSAGLVTWDCSGLTMRAYQAAGVSLPHSSAAQSRLGKQVSIKSLKPGDLLFYGRPVSHVGMYIGGGKMVHAPRSGSRVKITTSGSLGRKPLVGARRF
ncbi:MAG: peptidoglycan endopeptidase [Actinobacteria bacterium]|jgi:cell wall-associated NlpC family hydrolase|nr:peptidoglycan endopeptidase [Actinomycetota bacterium]NDE39093.1 peptidoglycan endopeptidase [Actinomycetota bacterium]